MTTMEERVLALRAGRELLQRIAASAPTSTTPEARKHVRTAQWYLSDYPAAESFDKRLADIEGIGLLLAAQRIARVRALIDELREGSNCEWAADAQRVSRHFPEPGDLVEAIRSPKGARAWAAFHLDRPPGRIGTLLPGDPPAWCGRPRTRGQALRRLRWVLLRLERDPTFPPLGVSQVWQLKLTLPAKGELGQRFCGMGAARLNEAFDAVQLSCQLIEAVVDGTLPAGLRQQALAQRLTRNLPRSEEFAVAAIGPNARQRWVAWLFGRAVRSERALGARCAAESGERGPIEWSADADRREVLRFRTPCGVEAWVSSSLSVYALERLRGRLLRKLRRQSQRAQRLAMRDIAD